MNVIIQVAGVKDLNEANILVKAGVTHIGFPPDTSDEETRDMIGRIPQKINKVLITYLRTAKEITELSNYLGTNIVQIHGNISVDELKRIKSFVPSLQIIKSLVVSDNNFDELCRTIQRLENYVDYFITDTYDPVTGASGATGKAHDWNVSKSIVKATTKPVILAGGLTPENVRQAIEFVRPAGVDVHTGVEDSLGNKDTILVNKFVKEAKKAFMNSYHAIL